MNWYGKPKELTREALQLASEGKNASDTEMKSIAASIRADFIEMLHDTGEVKDAYKALWEQYVDNFGLYSPKKPKTAKDMTAKTMYNTVYRSLNRVVKPLLAIKYAERYIVETAEVSEVFKNAEFDGELNFEIVSNNMKRISVERNERADAIIAQLQERELVALQTAEKAKFDDAVAQAVAKMMQG